MMVIYDCHTMPKQNLTYPLLHSNLRGNSTITATQMLDASKMATIAIILLTKSTPIQKAKKH